MTERIVEIAGMKVYVHRVQALVIGSGAAAWNCADWLDKLGVHDILLVTEGMNMGTSRNTGSDKQTYYKLAMQSGQPDCVDMMAEALASGRSVNRDTAYVEAANSAACFIKLAELGVPFPTNLYGEYVGYRTDHTTAKRATSAGPLTSKYITEVLQKSVMSRNVPIMDRTTVVELLKCGDSVCGAAALETVPDGSIRPHLFVTDHIVCATGGPASVYGNRVYPESQTGMTGMMIECGAECANLQEWQYGMASVKFRWNLSGTYQQVLPAYYSVDSDGVRRDFLDEYLPDPGERLDLVFLKGYQWPFDYAKISGSSLIDLLVYHEQVELGRRVYLDYRTNPAGLENGFGCLGNEARDYLEKSGALFGTPIDRLRKMNPAAIDLYRSHGIDLETEPLEITVAAQHNNGGAGVDINWETSVKGLYAAGEAAGTFGVYRPGGSALNSTQVGSKRAAEHIAKQIRSASESRSDVETDAVKAFSKGILAGFMDRQSKARHADVVPFGERVRINAADKLEEIRNYMADMMSACGAHVRNRARLEKLLKEAEAFLAELDVLSETLDEKQAVRWFKTRDMIITQCGMIKCMVYAAERIGSRGGAFYGELPLSGGKVYGSQKDFCDALRALGGPDNVDYDDFVLYYSDGLCSFRKARPAPQEDSWFENVWARYRRDYGRNNDMTELGLVSVSFRGLTTDDIIALVAETGLKGIEWGADVHVPAGRTELAEKVGRDTSAAGLSVFSYGSYFKVGEHNTDTFHDVLESAAALGAPVIRVWAGGRGSAQADSQYISKVAGAAARICDMAEPYGIMICFEYHPATLTDDCDCAVRLMKEINRSNIGLYWQPDFKKSYEDNLHELETVLPYVHVVHAFKWESDYTRLPLEAGFSQWEGFRDVLRRSNQDHKVLLEFVRGDSADQFRTDAATLRRLFS